MRRLIIKLLILGVLNEAFVMMGRGGGNSTIKVNCEEGRHMSKLLNGKFKVLISDGVEFKDDDD